MIEELLRYVLPKDLVESFNLVNIQEQDETLHLYLDECNTAPSEYKELSLLPNGFYESSTIRDFPLRDRKVILHIRRRRWVDAQGKSYSCRWDLTAEGTRYSKEFAFFLKDAFGYLPDSSPIS
jgi:hypothetical protein